MKQNTRKQQLLNSITIAKQFIKSAEIALDEIVKHQKTKGWGDAFNTNEPTPSRKFGRCKNLSRELSYQLVELRRNNL